jgi:hypothetical protein
VKPDHSGGRTRRGPAALLSLRSEQRPRLRDL